jgi:hypothetical protein
LPGAGGADVHEVSDYAWLDFISPLGCAFIPFLIRLVFLGDRDECLRSRGVNSKCHDFHATATLIFEKLVEWMGKEEA